MEQHLLSLSTQYAHTTKFVKIIGDECIANYPDRNLPTLLIYIDGDLRVQQVGVARLGGMGMQQRGIYFICIQEGCWVINDTHEWMDIVDLERFLRVTGAIRRLNADGELESDSEDDADDKTKKNNDSDEEESDWD